MLEQIIVLDGVLLMENFKNNDAFKQSKAGSSSAFGVLYD